MLEVKLQELDTMYETFKKTLLALPYQEEITIERLLQEVQDACTKNLEFLKNGMQNAKSKAIVDLANAELVYQTTVDEIVRNLPQYVHSEGKDALDDQWEAILVYTEFAMDQIKVLLAQTLCAALHASNLQLQIEERDDEE